MNAGWCLKRERTRLEGNSHPAMTPLTPPMPGRAIPTRKSVSLTSSFAPIVACAAGRSVPPFKASFAYPVTLEEDSHDRNRP